MYKPIQPLIEDVFRSLRQAFHGARLGRMRDIRSSAPPPRATRCCTCFCQKINGSGGSSTDFTMVYGTTSP